MTYRYIWPFGLSLIVSIFSLPAQADLVFTAPPRESLAKAEELYRPVADYLTKVTGQKVVFRNSNNWLTYQDGMRKDMYDIVFDGPAFIGWRIAKLHHSVLLKMPGNLVFAVAVKKEQNKINDISGLMGRTLCGFAPPNLATLAVLYEFDNPSRQPMVLDSPSFKTTYQDTVKGRCVGGILQPKLLEAMDSEAKALKVVYTSKPFPNQGITVSPRVTAEMRSKIIQAFASPEGKTVTQKLRDEFKGQDFVPARDEEYIDHAKLLKDVWSFGLSDTAKRP